MAYSGDKFKRYLSCEVEAIRRWNGGIVDGDAVILWIDRNAADFKRHWERSKCRNCVRDCGWKCAIVDILECTNYVKDGRIK